MSVPAFSSHIIFRWRRCHSQADCLRKIDCPDIALLDQNLPRIDGERVMAAIREHAHCNEIPIVIMSSSENRREHEAARKYGATFFRKSPDLTGFMELGALVKNLTMAAS